MPGVLAVLTGARLSRRRSKADPAQGVVAASGGSHAHGSRTASRPFTAPHYPLPTDKARFVGEAVAMVVADTVAAAKDGAEAVEIDYEVLAGRGRYRARRRGRMRRACSRSQRSNVCFDGELGDVAATEAAFARAAHVTRFETWVQRITGVPMEPRAAVAEFDPATGRYTLYAGNGGACAAQGRSRHHAGRAARASARADAATSAAISAPAA